MATIARSQAAGFTDYGAEAEDIARRRKMAEMMQMQALEPIKQETAGGYVVPISWTQGLAKALQAGVGGYQQGQLKDEARQLADRRNQALAQAISGMPQATTETAPGPDDGSGIPSPNRTTTTQPTWQQQAGWLGNLAQIGPDATALGSAVLGMQQRGAENQENRDMRMFLANQAQEAEKRNLMMRLADQALSRSERNDLMERLKQMEVTSREGIAEANRQGRMDLAQIAGSLRQPRQVTYKDIIDPLNPSRMISVDPATYNEQAYRQGNASGVLGVAGKEPTSAKRDEKASEGKDLLKTELDNLREHYRALNESGAIPSSERGTVSNVLSSVQASAPGQFLGRIGGTKEQDARNQIQSSRLRVMNAIKNATGMSAQQMNSNVELKTWLDSLTDPTKTYESNIGVIDAIENTFLKGAKPRGASGDFGAPTAPSASKGRTLRFDAQGNPIP